MTSARALVIFLLVTNYVHLTLAQTTFTRVTEGELVTQVGSYRGGSWGDYDGDGLIDLHLSSGNLSSNYEEGRAAKLFRNIGGGDFIEVTDVPMSSSSGGDGQGIWGDVDNDGDLDLIVSRIFDPQGNYLFINIGNGQFIESFNPPFSDDQRANFQGTWGDFNNDGLLDLFVGTGWLDDQDDGHNLLYQGFGNGTFEQIAPAPSFPMLLDRVYSVVNTWADYDDDGDLDLFVGNLDDVPNDLFRNDGDRGFVRLTGSPLVTDAASSYGAAWADFDNDGDPDIYVANGYSELSPISTSALYRNDGQDSFVRMGASDIGEALASYGEDSGGLAWADFDNDGWLDLFLTGYGGINNSLFMNDKGRGFIKVTSGSIVSDGGYSNGAATGDYDNDGFMDLFIASFTFDDLTEVNFLYHNEGNENHWLKLNLKGQFSNGAAIGVKVRVKATIDGSTFWQMREVSGGRGLGAQDDMRPNFGLGDATVAELVRIEWPSGIVQEMENVTADQILEVVEPLQLSIEPAIVLSWPVAAEGYVLYGANSVDGPWMEIETDVMVDGGKSTVTVSASEQMQFYQLQMP